MFEFLKRDYYGLKKYNKFSRDFINFLKTLKDKEIFEKCLNVFVLFNEAFYNYQKRTRKVYSPSKISYDSFLNLKFDGLEVEVNPYSLEGKLKYAGSSKEVNFHNPNEILEIIYYLDNHKSFEDYLNFLESSITNKTLFKEIRKFFKENIPLYHKIIYLKELENGYEMKIQGNSETYTIRFFDFKTPGFLFSGTKSLVLNFHENKAWMTLQEILNH